MDSAEVDVRVLQVQPKINALGAVVAPARIGTSSADVSLLSSRDLRKQRRRSAHEIVTLSVVRNDVLAILLCGKCHCVWIAWAHTIVAPYGFGHSANGVYSVVYSVFGPK